MDKDVLILVLLIAMISVSAIQTFQVMAFQSAINTLKATGTSTLTGTSASSGAQSQSSGVGGC